MFNANDRLEIINVLHLYAHYIDGGKYEEWVRLFAEDAVVQARAVRTGHDEIRELTKPSAQLADEGSQLRHLMTNIAVTEQAENSASVFANAVLTVVHAGTQPKVSTVAGYEGKLQKDGGKWLISHWNIIFDAPLDLS